MKKNDKKYFILKTDLFEKNAILKNLNDKL